jgi:hypothetical protein
MFPMTGNMDMGDPHANPVATPEMLNPQAAQRQSMIANALRQGATTQQRGSMVGQHYVAPAATQQLNNIASGLGSYYGPQ